MKQMFPGPNLEEESLNTFDASDGDRVEHVSQNIIFIHYKPSRKVLALTHLPAWIQIFREVFFLSLQTCWEI